MNNKPKNIAFLGVMAAFCLVLSYVEALLPPLYSAIPGIKVGLPNIVIVFLLYKMGVKQAVFVSAVRLLIVALLFGNAMTLLYSVAGAFLSLAAMALLKRFELLSIVGVSIVGGVFHNAGQIIVAALVLNSAEIGYYMPVLAVTGTLAGVAVGLLSALILKRTQKLKM